MSRDFTYDEESLEFQDPLSDYRPIEYETELHRSLAEETVDAIESQRPIQVDASSTVRQSIAALYAANASSLVVLSNGRVVGIFTERDVLEKVAERYSRLADMAICEVMTDNPTVVYETEPVATALAGIGVAGHRQVPVLSVDETLHSIVTACCVFEFIDQHDRE